MVVARPAPPHLEFMLLQRPSESRFAAGAYVFPRGVIEADDASPTWAGRLPPAGEATACVAALRELFEETGILPGSTQPGDPSGLAEARRALLADQTRFSRLAERLHVDFSSESIAYFARWRRRAIRPTTSAISSSRKASCSPATSCWGRGAA
ncbi:NUDIX domain-containing protein [Candidatus Palauibacter sp.]|uniref:NUDIX domain-containing protein n=1 Tax=Candidatus Palauibacter sp. TaxID=3101350 RepID=UPI003C700F0D